MEAMTKRQKRDSLSTLFEGQIQILIERGVPTSIIRSLTIQKNGINGVLEVATEMVMGDNHIPFLPVLPKGELSLDAQMMALVRNGEKMGYADPGAHLIRNSVVTPDYPYYLFDVEVRTMFLRGRAEGRGLRHLTVEEVIAVCVHGSEKLKVGPRECLLAGASEWQRENAIPRVPDVHMADKEGRPWLTIYHPGM
ncbi:MAG TPA: hypothetical protein VJC15_04325 [Candidatus Paceibacterota bacterium]